MIYNWIKIAFRNFGKNKLATFINVFGLTLGLIGLVLTLLYTNDQLSFDQWNPEKDRVFAIGHLFDHEADVWGVSNPIMEKAKANISEIEDVLLVSAMGYQPANITAGEKVVYATKIVDATSNFFSFFPFQFLEGKPETAIKADNQVAVSEDFAKKLFGDENAMGKDIQIGSNTFVINGVYRIPGKSVMMPEVVFPFNKLDEYWGNFNYNGYLKTKTNISIPDLKEKYDRAVWREQFEKEAKEEGITLDELMEKYAFETIITTLPDSHFDMKNSMTLYEPYGNRNIIKIMFGISILILMISIVNFINLSLAGAVKRAKEVGLRKAIGASRNQIIYQNLFETLMLTLFSLLAAMVGIELILPFFNEFMQTEIEINPAKFFVQMLLIVIGTSLLTGIIPALYLSKFRTIEVLKGSFSRSPKGIYLRNAMLGLQFMIAAFFFVGSLIVYFQISYLNKLDLGFDKQQLMVLDFQYKDGKPFRSYEQLKTYLENMDGITDVNSVRPLAGSQTGYSTTDVKYKDKSASNVLYNSIDFGYPEMMKMKLLKGRFLSEKFASDTVNNVVINETLAKNLGIYEDPINKTIGDNIKVVGMVKDFHVFDAFSPIQPLMMHHWKALEGGMIYNMRNIVIKFQPEKLDEILGKLETYWPQSVIQNKPFEYSFLDKNFEKTYQQYTRQQKIFGVMTGMVILIALLGLYALSSFIIEQRLKEIAIRKTLGAETKDIVARFSKPYLIIGSVAILLSFPLVWYFSKLWLQDFAYRISIPWLAFAICFIVLLSLSFLVASLRAWSATKINPVKYLKYE